MNKLLSLCSKAALCCALLTSNAQATTILVKTNMGDFEAELFDTHTPKTVANFLSYVENGDYTDAVFHRSIKGFIVQTGGFTYDYEEHNVSRIETTEAVENEPVFSNVRGTIAMAKLGGNPDSATSQWFINTGDNASNLDGQNGGFTVFGKVSEQGMEIIDAINYLKTYNLSPGNMTFAETPLQGLPAEDEVQVLTEKHLVLVESITVINPEPETASELPPLNDADANDDNTDSDVADKEPESNDNSSSGGSLSWLLALFTATVALRKQK
ncbi:peptidylprolyl isomerase [Thalassotalea ponticola]|uniref:peptidylprolyl isomerase n=1 Tax=Thalassotalea ponticola TaxID=1523392 RepID=UPI0025B4FAC4|nr:peptidylprolyl isomerase [Thalassotalea ponticola]MDN3652967.1 peptidylprolyl isomerase [Thalassotalea ponticola]